jgi:hypothetical protein
MKDDGELIDLFAEVLMSFNLALMISFALLAH